MAVIAIIPVRYGSTRFPGKPLALIGGKPMIQHVYENTARAPGLDRVIVATDDERILQTARAFGAEAMMTSSEHGSGTDRLAEVAKKIRAEIVVNVQGDLPFIRSETIHATLKPLRQDAKIPMGTAKTPIFDEAEWLNPNVVKVITDTAGFALYFSRAPIPYLRDDGPRPIQRKLWGYRHVGIYGYRREFLLKFARMRPSALEQSEKLEQLRALSNGYRIRVADVDETAVEVDTPADLEKAEEYLRSENNNRTRRRTAHG
ncbi:MAG TPA: 3-deoxy-manno-octulosonate cytidylyltransferase [Candidatus Binatia bacterium]|jgi:3-deoxy-manno-octulosonate cytidylyltransferase (CMP-KDO synthetase)